jgi:hypothetical protein
MTHFHSRALSSLLHRSFMVPSGVSRLRRVKSGRPSLPVQVIIQGDGWHTGWLGNGVASVSARTVVVRDAKHPRQVQGAERGARLVLLLVLHQHAGLLDDEVAVLQQMEVGGDQSAGHNSSRQGEGLAHLPATSRLLVTSLLLHPALSRATNGSLSSKWLSSSISGHKTVMLVHT